MLLLGDEKLTITKIRLVYGQIVFEAEGTSQNDYNYGIPKGVTILDPQRTVVHTEPEYEVEVLTTVNKGDKLILTFNLDPMMNPSVQRWVRVE